MYVQQRDEYLESFCKMATRKISVITIFGTMNNSSMKIDHFQLGSFSFNTFFPSHGHNIFGIKWEQKKTQNSACEFLISRWMIDMCLLVVFCWFFFRAKLKDWLHVPCKAMPVHGNLRNSQEWWQKAADGWLLPWVIERSVKLFACKQSRQPTLWAVFYW